MNATAESEFTIYLDDQTEVYGRCWEVAEPRARVMIVHGFGDHGGRFAHVAQFLGSRGFSVYAPDMRGHGRSQGRRGYVRRFATLYADLVRMIRLLPGSTPLAVYAQSWGGMLATNLALRSAPSTPFQLLVANSPAFRLAMKPEPWKVLVGRTLGTLFPRMTLKTGLDIQQLSHDPRVAERLLKDPHRHGQISPRMFFSWMDDGAWAIEHACQLDIPMLLNHGDADKIIDHRGSIEFAARAGNHCTLKIWAGQYHELHNESRHMEFLKSVADWIDGKLPELGSPGSAAQRPV